IVLSEGEIKFSPDKTEYEVRVKGSEIKISAKPSNKHAKVEGTGSVYVNTVSKAVIKVTAEDGDTVMKYALTFIRDCDAKGFKSWAILSPNSLAYLMSPSADAVSGKWKQFHQGGYFPADGQPVLVPFINMDSRDFLSKIPKDANKVVIIAEPFSAIGKDASGIEKDINLYRSLIEDIKRHAGSARVYITGAIPPAKSFPRTLRYYWSELVWSFGEIKHLRYTAPYMRPDRFNAFNAALKGLAEELGASFISLDGSGLIDSKGYLKEEYASWYGTGEGSQLNQNGIVLLGDAIVKAAE
ncbi:MAG TPA: hypothetical protein PLZ84_07020, partial [Clostridia bacterium]|nr:hypothetical protein [Clostridia bacterium]